jgi:hypothetical protein
VCLIRAYERRWNGLGVVRDGILVMLEDRMDGLGAVEHREWVGDCGDIDDVVMAVEAWRMHDWAVEQTWEVPCV